MHTSTSDSPGRLEGVRPFASSDPDSGRIWWRDAGVHKNLIFPVHPDPISGQHAWHQRVRVRVSEPDDQDGDIRVDTSVSQRVYREWLSLASPASAALAACDGPPGCCDRYARRTRRIGCRRLTTKPGLQTPRAHEWGR